MNRQSHSAQKTFSITSQESNTLELALWDPMLPFVTRNWLSFFVQCWQAILPVTENEGLWLMPTSTAD